MSDARKVEIIQEMNGCTAIVISKLAALRKAATDVIVDIDELDSEQLGLLFRGMRGHLDEAELQLNIRDQKVAYLAGYAEGEAANG